MLISVGVVCSDAGVGVVDVSIDGPPTTGDQVKPAVNQQEDGVWLVEYTPLAAGPHHVNVNFCGQPIKNSPFTAHVKPSQYIIRPHRSTTYVDASYCYRPSSVVCRPVCRSVCRSREPIKKN